MASFLHGKNPLGQEEPLQRFSSPARSPPIGVALFNKGCSPHRPLSLSLPFPSGKVPWTCISSLSSLVWLIFCGSPVPDQLLFSPRDWGMRIYAHFVTHARTKQSPTGPQMTRDPVKGLQGRHIYQDTLQPYCLERFYVIKAIKKKYPMIHSSFCLSLLFWSHTQ